MFLISPEIHTPPHSIPPKKNATPKTPTAPSPPFFLNPLRCQFICMCLDGKVNVNGVTNEILCARVIVVREVSTRAFHHSLCQSAAMIQSNNCVRRSGSSISSTRQHVFLPSHPSIIHWAAVRTSHISQSARAYVKYTIVHSTRQTSSKCQHILTASPLRPSFWGLCMCVCVLVRYCGRLSELN